MKKQSKPYITCPDCGSHLDHGEVCTCKGKRQAPANPHKPALVTVA